LMAVVRLVDWAGCVVAVPGAVRAFAGFATFGHAHIRGLGTPRPLFVARPLSKVERAPQGAGAQATNRGVVCASREVLGPPRQPQRVVSQREFVSLLRVVGVGVGSGAVVVQVAISQQ
jgi:hypothetical protein